MNISIEPLGPEHDRGAFRCNNDTVDQFCRDCLDHHQRHRHRVFVAVEKGQKKVLGFYCLRIVLIGPKNYAQPELEFAMFGVREDLQGNGIGSALLVHAFQQAYIVAKAAGITSLWLDAANDKSVPLYRRYGFEQVEGHKLKMFIPVNDIIDAVENPEAPSN